MDWKCWLIVDNQNVKVVVVGENLLVRLKVTQKEL